MRMRISWALVSLAAITLVRPLPASGQISFSAGINIGATSDFYDPLTPYGQWVQVGSYGRCWHPTVTVEAGWRPYSVGQWESTDAGWYWASDEPWAWACYHYGYWVLDPNYGWVWVPGTEWAPAWVVWRQAPDYSYIGWAPCGPSGVVVSPSWFSFVAVGSFGGFIRPNMLIVNDTRVFERTRAIGGGISRETRTFDGRRERVVVNTGPGVDNLQRVTRRTFTQRPIRDVVRSTPLPERVMQQAQPWRREGARTTEQVRGGANQRPGSATQPATREERNATPSGRGQERNYQQPPSTRQTQPTPSTREERNVAPSGREQPRTYQTPPTQTAPQPSTRPTQPAPSTREDRNATPSGREQPRVYQQPPARTPSEPAVKPAQPTPSTREEKNVTPSGHEQPSASRPIPTPPETRSREVAPEHPTTPTGPERTLPPTGREAPKREEPRSEPATPRAEPAHPAHPETPARPSERAPEPDRGRDKDHP